MSAAGVQSSSSSGCRWYGLEEAESWSLERPPDRDADFQGDTARWDVARSVWYKTVTGKQLPPSTDADARKKAWDQALGARRSRLKRAAHSEAQADARRQQQAKCMQRLRAEVYEVELNSVAVQLKTEEATLVMDDPDAVLRRSQLVLPVMRKLAKEARHLEAALFGLHALVPAFNSENWVDLWGSPFQLFRRGDSEDALDELLARPRCPSYKPRPDTLHVVCLLAASLENVQLWEHASHWWEVAACIKEQARVDDTCDHATLSCELRSILCQITADRQADPSLQSEAFEFCMHMTLHRLLLLDTELGDRRGRVTRELRELCAHTVIECFHSIGWVDSAIQYVRTHRGLQPYGSLIEDYDWHDVLRMLLRQ